MDRLMCARCGENLHEEGDLLKCGHCGAAYERGAAEEASSRLADALGEAKLELLANRKRLLWDAAHEKYPSKERVVEAANAVLSVSAEDFLANVYLHSHDRDPLKLNRILAGSEVLPSQASEAFRWLLPSLSSRTVGPLHDFVDRHFTGKERFEKATAIESEASKISQGIYEPGLPRDVFLCYSSKDMERVVGLLDLLEQNGFACFAAFRNLRHGKGAQEDYLSSIKAAMCACDVLVFFSSANSRSMDCDAMRVELPYLIQELPEKPRIEYLLEDYGDTPFMVKRTLKKAFPSQEYCRDEEDLMVRIQEVLEAKDSRKDDEVERLRRELEEERSRHQKELEEARRASESAKKQEPKDEDALMEKIQKAIQGLSSNKVSEPKERQKEAGHASEFDEDELRRQAEEEERKATLQAKRSAFRVKGDYVYYGRYPQAKVTAAATIKALKGLKPGNNGYIQYNGKEYAEAKGKYFLVRPIKWKILKKKGGEALVVSDLLLDQHRYNENYEGLKDGHYVNNYMDSEIRAWLNGEFLSSAFPSGDKRILAKEVDNSAATTGFPSNPYACENTVDKVFLLSCKDYQNASYGFTNNASRQCAPTAYAVAREAFKFSDSGNCYYWTRSPYSTYSSYAWSIGDGGSLTDSRVYYDFFGVRPAIWLNIVE
ncbi:MAG: DUF6273 domain-containing protein [Bacilli bacterium]|nr:DUF6273 domain-containing protein [Bacilli bacterium]